MVKRVYNRPKLSQVRRLGLRESLPFTVKVGVGCRKGVTKTYGSFDKFSEVLISRTRNYYNESSGGLETKPVSHQETGLYSTENSPLPNLTYSSNSD